ncbi:AAA family ATPase, partial [Streptomyces seoulensis]
PGREAPAAPAPGAVPAPWSGAAIPAPRSAGSPVSGSPVSGAARGPGADAVPGGHRADGCRAASVLMVRFCLGPEFDDLAAGDIDRVLDTVCELAREEIRKAGGCAPSSIGSSLIGLFEEETGREDHAQRAVRAALAVRDSLSVSASPLAPPTMVIKGLSVHAAVATGTAFVCRWPPAAPGGGEPWIGGEPVDVCEALLCPAPPGEVHICDETRRRTRETVTCGRLSGPGAGWRVHTVRPAAGEPGRRFEREPDLDLMTGFLGRARQLSTPHLITVLGPSVMDRSRLLMEFHRRLAQAPDPVRVLNGSVAEAGDALSAPAGMLAAYCGLARDTDSRTAERCLAHAVRTVADAATAAELLPPLRSLLAPVRSGDERRLLLAAWRRFMALAALRAPLVLVWDALHRADDALLDTVEQLCADCPDAPLLVVVGAHNDLLTGRPGWAAGLQHAMTLRLTPLTEDTLDHLLRSVFLPDTDAA